MGNLHSHLECPDKTCNYYDSAFASDMCFQCGVLTTPTGLSKAHPVLSEGVQLAIPEGWPIGVSNQTQTCGNCKHWQQDEEPPFGKCLRIPMGCKYHMDDVKDELACTRDGSDYYAAILCQSDFGCVLWETLSNV